MLLRSLTIRKLGPFYDTLTLPVDPAVTILTGANDTGKSSVLSCFDLLFNQKIANEMMVNHDHIQESHQQWDQDSNLIIEAEFRIDSGRDFVYPHGQGYQAVASDLATVTRCVAGAEGRNWTHYSTNLKERGDTKWNVQLPNLLFVPGNQTIRSIVDATQPNDLEKALLAVAFGGSYDPAKYQAMNSLNFKRAIREADDRLNAHMARVMPMEASLRFAIEPMDGKRNQFGFLLRDRYDGETPFGNRGTGVRKMITLFTELVTQKADSYHRLILLDEPENSLHADAQHLLRELLYQVAQANNTQVIYTTHSPAMINPMRPEQVRLLRRQKQNGRASSVLAQSPCDKNYFGIRSSLGLTAADSLLFGPVTVIIEGATEFMCLPIVIEKLCSSKVSGFENAKKLLSLAHFLDGMGDSFEFFCRLAESHGTRPVLLLDGDKRKTVQKQKVRDKHPQVPIVIFPEGTEFEEIVSVEIYFRAIAELSGKGDAKQLQEEWNKWLAKDIVSQRKMFSKRVWDWFEEAYPDTFVSKQSAMRKALELADPKEIRCETLRELLVAIATQLKGSSFT